MKQKSQMTPDEFRTYVASEVESIRSEIELLRVTAEHLAEPAGSPVAASTVQAKAFAARRHLPELQKGLPG